MENVTGIENRISIVDKTLEKYESNSMKIKQEIYFIKKRQASSRMVMTVLDMMKDPYMSKTKYVFDGVIDLFFELRSLDMNSEIETLL